MKKPLRLVARVLATSFSTIFAFTAVIAIAFSVLEAVLPEHAKFIVLVALAVIVFLLAVAGWIRFGMVLEAYIRAPSDEAMAARTAEVFPAALGATAAIGLVVNAILGLPLKPPISTAFNVLTILLLSAPALLFVWRYRPRWLRWMR